MLAFRDNAAQLITGVQQMMADGRTPEEIGAALQSDFGGAQMVFPGAIDGLLVELR
jgi:hypothetical protein